MSNRHTQNKYNKIAGIYDKKWEGYLNSTHKAVLDFLGRDFKGPILDASGGTGLLAEKIIRIGNKGVEISLVDISEEMLKIAEKRLKKFPNARIFKGDVHNLPFAPESFSTALSASAFHYYADPGKAVAELCRVLKPGGSLIIVDWSRDRFYFKIFNLILKASDKAHVNIYTLNELERIAAKAGFKVEKAVKWRYKMWPLMGIKAAKK